MSDAAGFTLTRTLPCSPEQAWRWLTDPDEMNRWSTAPIRLAASGACGRADAIGALRVVTLPGRTAKLREVVEHNEFPHIFRYRVYDGGPFLLDHRGEQRIDATPDGCRITWQVSMRLVSAAASRVLARVVARQVAQSLDRLVELVECESTSTAPVEIPRALRPPHGVADMTTRLSEARDSLDEQAAIADRLAAANDPKRWFARVYQYVTEEMIDTAIEPAGAELDNPDWVLTLIPAFHEYFIANLRSYELGHPAEPAWHRAWSICETPNPTKPHVPLMSGMLAGVSAHIDADLPRALAAVHRQHYPTRDIREFRPDYLRLAPIFSAASDRLLADLPRSHKPWWTPLAARIHPQVRDALLARQGYDVRRHRVQAFARAVELIRPEQPEPDRRAYPC